MSQNTELKAQTKKPGLNKKGIAAWINNYSFILIALAIFIAYLFINHGATTWSGVMNILRHSAVVGIMAFGMGLVIITGGIDLSVGSMLALVGSFSVVVFNATDSVLLTLLFALVAGGLCGLFNGVLIGLVKMPAFIVTLATMLIFRSVAQYYLRTTGSSIFNMTGTLDHYASFYGFGQLKIATVPVVGIVLLLVVKEPHMSGTILIMVGAAAVLFAVYYPALSGLPIPAWWADALEVLPSFGFY